MRQVAGIILSFGGALSIFLVCALISQASAGNGGGLEIKGLEFKIPIPQIPSSLMSLYNSISARLPLGGGGHSKKPPPQLHHPLGPPHPPKKPKQFPRPPRRRPHKKPVGPPPPPKHPPPPPPPPPPSPAVEPDIGDLLQNVLHDDFPKIQHTKPHLHHPHTHLLPHQEEHDNHAHAHHHHDHHHHPTHVLDHVHQDEQGSIYVHDPDSVVKFFYKENLHGPSNRVDIHHDGCREVPMDYWYQRPKSLWAKHCITLYQSGHCKGHGVQVAGMVGELRSAGMHYGVNSFKPCEKNIRIRFMPPAHDKHHHHHHHH